jgi:2-polyprenyl-3-methyl-5-hydroxy-6-metoxy-1,4-benzoquinol methylase
MVDLCWASFAESGIDPSSYSFARGELLGDDLGGPYDGILALGVLQYQDDEDALLRHFKSLLKPGGALVITGPIKARLTDVFGLSSAHRRWREGRAQRVSADRQLLFQISVNDYSKARLSHLLEDAGFEVLRCRGHGYTNLAVINRWRSLDLAAHRLLSGLASVLPIDGWANDLVALAALPRP